MDMNWTWIGHDAHAAHVRNGSLTKVLEGDEAMKTTDDATFAPRSRARGTRTFMLSAILGFCVSAGILLARTDAAQARGGPTACVCRHCAQSAPICFLGVSGFCACKDLECSGGMPCAIVWR